MSDKKITALQKAISHYEELSLQGSNQAYVVAKYLKTLIPYEREVMAHCFLCGDDAVFHGLSDKEIKSFKQYYKETYEQ
jgi:hypothetical protein